MPMHHSEISSYVPVWREILWFLKNFPSHVIFTPLPFITYITIFNALIVWMTVFSELNYESSIRTEIFCLIYRDTPSPDTKHPLKKYFLNEWMNEWIKDFPQWRHQAQITEQEREKCLSIISSAARTKEHFSTNTYNKCNLLWALNYLILFGENVSYLSPKCTKLGFCEGRGSLFSLLQSWTCCHHATRRHHPTCHHHKAPSVPNAQHLGEQPMDTDASKIVFWLSFFSCCRNNHIPGS